MLSAIAIGLGLGGVVYATTSHWTRSHGGRSRPNLTAAGVRDTAPWQLPPFTISADPARVTLTPGASAFTRIRILRRRMLRRPRYPGGVMIRARAWISITSPLPAGVTAAFSPHRVRSPGATLWFWARTWALPGSYRVGLEVRNCYRPCQEGHTHDARTAITLVIPSPRPAFSISLRPTTGVSIAPLSPGASSPIDLRLTNRERFPLQVNKLVATIQTVTAPYADAAHPCTPGDFAIVQFSGVYDFRLAASSTHTLSALGIPQAQWPLIQMLDRPVNQDGCQRAKVSLTFAGTATGGSS